MNVDKICDLLKFSSCEIISEIELKNILSLKKDVVIKIGFDPTGDNLHLGHVVILRKLRILQDFGYSISVLIGDFTAMIGDPSGRSEVRKQITRKDIVNNFLTYRDQIFKILNPNYTKIFFNSSWLKFLGLESILTLMSNITVSRLLERNDFKFRYSESKPIYLHEFIYPLLQSYDSIFMNADIEFGGIDQKFNFILTREFQKKFNFSSQVVVMTPILIGLDGKNKMSKSLGNVLNIYDDYYDMFCKVMSIPDFIVKDYYVFLNFLLPNDYDIIFSSIKNFMELKLDLAFKIVSLFYGENLAFYSKNKFINFFSKKNFEDFVLEFIYIDSFYILLSDFLIKFKFISSNSEFKRFIKSNSIEVDLSVISDRNFTLMVNTFYFIKVGKKKVLKFFLKTT